MRLKHCFFLIILLVIVIFISGCASQETPTEQTTITQPPSQELPDQPKIETIQSQIQQPEIQEQTKKWRQLEVPCTGEFFDSHIHFDALPTKVDNYLHAPELTLTSKELAKRMSEQKVDCGVLFVWAFDMDKQFDFLRENLSGLNVGLIPFFSLPNPSLSSIQAVYHGREGAFFGIGEIGFYEGPLVGTSLTQDPWPAIFEYAAKEKLFLMLHPTQKQASDLEKVLAQYPNTKIILHGFELLNSGLIEKWLSSYKNLYWTYDLATMFDGYLYRVENAEDFIMWYEANKKRYLSSVRNKLLPLLEAAPDRVMWGTDIVSAWHVEPEVYNRLMEFSRELIDSLPSQYRSNYAHDNAQHIFDSGIKFEPLP